MVPYKEYQRDTRTTSLVGQPDEHIRQNNFLINECIEWPKNRYWRSIWSPKFNLFDEFGQFIKTRAVGVLLNGLAVQTSFGWLPFTEQCSWMATLDSRVSICSLEEGFPFEIWTFHSISLAFNRDRFASSKENLQHSVKFPRESLLGVWTPHPVWQCKST